MVFYIIAYADTSKNEESSKAKVRQKFVAQPGARE
jgi:hypothetical protein